MKDLWWRGRQVYQGQVLSRLGHGLTLLHCWSHIDISSGTTIVFLTDQLPLFLGIQHRVTSHDAIDYPGHRSLNPSPFDLSDAAGRSNDDAYAHARISVARTATYRNSLLSDDFKRSAMSQWRNKDAKP